MVDQRPALYSLALRSATSIQGGHLSHTVGDARAPVSQRYKGYVLFYIPWKDVKSLETLHPSGDHIMSKRPLEIGGIGKLDFLSYIPTPLLDLHHVTPSADKWAAIARIWDWVPLECFTALVKCPLSLLGTSLHQLVLIWRLSQISNNLGALGQAKGP